MVSSRPVSPRRTLSYLSDPWPWTRTLRRSAASSASSVNIAPPSPKHPSGLAGKKLVAVARPMRAEAAALVARAKRLRGVVEHKHSLGFGDRRDRIMVGGLPEQIDRNDRFRLEPVLPGDRDPVLQRSRIDIERRLIDIDEYRRRADQRDHLAGRAERKGRTDHGIARADFLRHQHHQQRIGAASAGITCFAPLKAARSASSCVTSGPLMNWQWVKHAGDRIIDALAETVTLLDDVNKRDSLSWHMLIHAVL